MYSPFKEGLWPNVQKTNNVDGLFEILFGPLILKIVSPLDPHSLIARRNPGATECLFWEKITQYDMLQLNGLALHSQTSNTSHTKSKNLFLVSSCRCLCPIHWSQVLSWEWRCSWNSACRRCSNYIWVINKFIVYYGAPYIRGLTLFFRSRNKQIGLWQVLIQISFVKYIITKW